MLVTGAQAVGAKGLTAVQGSVVDLKEANRLGLDVGRDKDRLGTARARNPMVPRWVAPNEAACRSCSAGSTASGGSNAIAVQRSTAPAAPIDNSTMGVSAAGIRDDNANSTISENTPNPQSAPITGPLMPAARHCSAEKP